jgi:biotin carboxyl carrier protein
MKFVVRVDGREKVAHVEKRNGIFAIQLDGKAYTVDCQYFGDTGYLSLLIDNKSYLIESAPVRPERGEYYAWVMGRHYDLEVLDELLVAVRDAERVRGHSGPYVLAAPMPGLIVDIKVKPGDTVEPGAAIVVMEAMKMQNELSAEVGGVVKEVRVKVRQKVESQAPLVVIEKE